MSLLLAPVEADAASAALRLISSDLAYLFDDGQVPEGIQAKIAECGYTDTKVFAKVGDTAAQVSDFLRVEVTLLPDTSVQHQAMTVRLLTVWEAAVKLTYNGTAD